VILRRQEARLGNREVFGDRDSWRCDCSRHFVYSYLLIQGGKEVVQGTINFGEIWVCFGQTVMYTNEVGDREKVGVDPLLLSTRLLLPCIKRTENVQAIELTAGASRVSSPFTMITAFSRFASPSYMPLGASIFGMGRRRDLLIEFSTSIASGLRSADLVEE